MGEGARLNFMISLFSQNLNLRLPHFCFKKWGREEGVHMHKLIQPLLLSLILLTACGPASAATSVPATETLPPTRQVTFTPPLTETLPPEIMMTSTSTIMPTQGIDIPDNTLIAYSAGLKGIYELHVKQGTSRPIIVFPSGFGILYLYPSWSPSGDMIAFQRESQIYIIDRNGSNLHIFRKVSGTNQSEPAWSPDGEHIAFLDSNLGIVITDASGNKLFQLGTSSVHGTSPAWSPDGKRIAFVGVSMVNRYSPWKLYLINSDGTNLHAVTEAIVGEGRISWSPDGNKITFRSFEGCGDINVLDLNTGDITNLTNTPSVMKVDPAWSPDGKYIVFSKAGVTPCEQDKVFSYDGGNLYMVDIDGKQETQLTFDQGGFQQSLWPIVILQPDWKYSLTKAGANLNVRENPSKDATSLAKLPQGVIFTALDGPVVSDDNEWWRIRTEDGIEGWIVDVPGWYMLESAP